MCEIEKMSKVVETEDGLSSPPCKRRASSRGESLSNVTRKDLICCFCREVDKEENLVAAGTFHAKKKTTDKKHVSELSKTWVKMAKVLERDELLQDLARSDIASNELYYHKSTIRCCYQNFRYQYNAKINSGTMRKVNIEEEWIKCSSFNKVCHSLICRENENPGTVFLVKELEDLYHEILRNFKIVNNVSHVSRFADSFLSVFHDLEKRTVNNKVTVYFKSTVDKYIGESIDDASDFIKAVQRIVIPLRKVIDETENYFNGSFEEGCQRKSVPIQLLTVISMLVDGVGTQTKGFSQQSLTISQLIQSNFKKKIKKTEKMGTKLSKIHKKRETPVVIYNSLKLYGTVRSKSLINHFFHLGIAVSYDRVLN